jgi:hypothetical protein
MPYGNLLADVVQGSTANTPPVFKDGNGTTIGTLCRAWVNFNGTGTVAIRASFNVSSITDNGTGLFRVNFTTAMPDTNYSTNVTNGASQSSGSGPFGGYVNTDVAQTTALVAITTSNFNTQFDGSVVNVAVFR